MELVGNPDVPWYFKLYGELVVPDSDSVCPVLFFSIDKEM